MNHGEGSAWCPQLRVAGYPCSIQMPALNVSKLSEKFSSDPDEAQETLDILGNERSKVTW